MAGKEMVVTITVDKEAEEFVKETSACVLKLVKGGLLTQNEAERVADRLKKKLVKYIKVN